jgi:hypothetical protein
MGASGNSNVVKSFQSFVVNDGLLAKVVEAVKAGEKEARSTGDVQSFEVFYKGFRQNICIGRIYLVPPSIVNDRKNFPVALLYGTVVREFHGEEVADLTTNKIGDSEFDEYSKADFDRIKESLFGVGDGKYESIVLFAPSWTNVREYVCFKFTKDDEKLTNLVRHLVFSVYYNPSVSSGFDALMTDFNTSKLDVTDVTPKLSYPGVAENPLTEFPNLSKQANSKKKIFLTVKTADEITKQVLDPQELDVFESLDQALTNAMMPETKGVEEASDAGEGGFTAPTQHEIPEVHVGAEEKKTHKHKCPQCKGTFTCNNPKDCPGEGKEALCGSCPSKKSACAPHETPITNVGPGDAAHEKQESMVDAVKESTEEAAPKANPIEGKPIGVAIDETGVPRREEEERKVGATKIPLGKKADWDSFGHKSHPGNRTDQDIINNLKNYSWGQAAIPLEFGDRKAGVPRVKHAGVRDSLNDFERGYIEAALWSSMDNSDPNTGGDPLDSNYDIEDISPEAMERIRKDCAEFQKINANLLEEYYQRMGSYNEHSAESRAGHDFWLTRNGHGAGFWDRTELKEGGLGKKLTEAAHKFGECDLYIGDDHQVHVASTDGSKLDASYIAHHLAKEAKDTREGLSSKAKNARNAREARLDAMRSQVGVTKRADVALTFDEIWDSATEDFGAAPEVPLPGESQQSEGGEAAPWMTSNEPEKDKAISDGDAEKQENDIPTPTEEHHEEPKAEEPKHDVPMAEEKKEEEPKEANSKQADTADNSVEIDSAALPTSQETGESQVVQQHKQYDQKMAGKIQDRINELEAIIKPHIISVENGAEPQLDENGKVKEDLATCGTCGMTWNDALITGRTPAPSARCPYEYVHPEILELKKLKRRLHQGSAKQADTADNPANEKDGDGAMLPKTNKEKAVTAAKQRVFCDQCQMLSINGVPCHETGCPNSKKHWDADRQEWVRYVKCWECGDEFPEDEAEAHAESHLPEPEPEVEEEMEVEASADAPDDIKARLEYLRGELRAERISYEELAELQGLAEYIEPGDVELLEAAGVPEFPEDPDTNKQSAMGDENSEAVKMDFGMGDLADIVMTEDDETPAEGENKENGGAN